MQEVVALARSYCGACHAVPPPDSLPKRSWPAVIRTMVGIAQTRHGRAGLSERQMNDLIALYYGSAPEALPRLPRPDVGAWDSMKRWLSGMLFNTSSARRDIRRKSPVSCGMRTSASLSSRR